jgi:E3 ubiquitin-protein ligase EDD1
LFGAPRQPITIQSASSHHPAGSVNPLEVIPTRLGLSTRSEFQAGFNYAPLAVPGSSPHLLPPPVPLVPVAEVVQETPQNLSLKDSDADVIEVARSSSSNAANIVASSVIVSPRRASSSAVQSVIVRTGSVRDCTTSLGVGGSSSSGAATSSSFRDRDRMDEPNPISGSASSSATTAGLNSGNRAVLAYGFGITMSSDVLLGRWRLTLDLFGRVFIDDVGSEAGSVIAELGGFPVKEARFRRDMERLRNMQQRDLTLFKVDRDRGQLILQTFKELNTQYNAHCRRATATQPPLAVSRVKVTFKDEPGEGSGVARSYYTAIAEAILTQEKLPNLDAAQVGAGSKTSQSQSSMVSYEL